MASKNPKLSEIIGAFCKAATNSRRDYIWNFDEVNRLDGLTQDYLHQLELMDLKYAERAKIATQLQLVRKERRLSKDTLEALQPFIEFLDTKQGEQMVNLLREVLGQTRKVENRMGNRVYKYRVLEDSDGDICE